MPLSIPQVSIASPASLPVVAPTKMVSSAITSVSTPQLVASTHASNATALPSHLQASSVLASPPFPARLAAPSLAPILPSLAVPRQALNFQPSSLNFSQITQHQEPPVGSYVGSSASVPMVLQLPSTDQRFKSQSATSLASQTQVLPGTPFLFTNNYPVAGPSGLTPGSCFPGHFFSSPGSSSLPAGIFSLFVVGPGIPPVAPKLVAAIVSGEFVELASLLDDHTEPEALSFWLVADQLIIRPTKRRKEITDIIYIHTYNFI